MTPPTAAQAAAGDDLDSAEYVELIAETPLRDGPTLPAGALGYVVGCIETLPPKYRVRWLGLDALAVHAADALRPSTAAAWEAARATLTAPMIPDDLIGSIPALPPDEAIAAIRRRLDEGGEAGDLATSDVRALLAAHDAHAAELARLRAPLAVAELAAIEARHQERLALPLYVVAGAHVEGERRTLSPLPPTQLEADVGTLLAHIVAHAAEIAAHGDALGRARGAIAEACDVARAEGAAAEQARFVRWLRAHDEATSAWEAATELQEWAGPMEMLLERTAPPDDTSTEARSFTLTIGGRPVRMDVEHVDRVLEGRRESFWSACVRTKAAGLRTYDHRHCGNTRMEAVGWTLHVLAGEGMGPTAMVWGVAEIDAKGGE